MQTLEMLRGAVITGAGGFIGSALRERLDSPVVLTRNAARFPGARAHEWEPAAGPPPAEAFAGAEVVFHLAGETVAQFWTRSAKRRIRESRAAGTENLVRGLEKLERRPRALIVVSGNNYYGDRGDDLLGESEPPGKGFLSEVCLEWEGAAARAAELGVRVVILRLGLILGRGGALAKMRLPFRLGLGGRLGSGRQWISWLHIADLVELFLFAATNDAMRGTYNAASPNPVRNAEFTRALARVLRRPAILPVPAFLLRGVFGEAASMVLDSQRVSTESLRRAGFDWRFADLVAALTNASSAGP